ncbi:MAG: phosphoribosylformylglycinamidine synthase subunit PurS [Planctomycetota bacterium]|jgi:phosphoribosylformylglycinamidine synthase
MPSHVARFEVRTRPDRHDARSETTLAQARTFGYQPESIGIARIYLIESTLSETQIARVRDSLLVNPVVETISPDFEATPDGRATIEVHPQPGVMDPASQTVENAIRVMLDLPDEAPIRVSTGWRYDIAGMDQSSAIEMASRVLANRVIHDIHTEPFHPERFPVGHEYSPQVHHVSLRELDDDALASLSRDAHLFLSLDEMRQIQSYYASLDREPTEIELETLAQTWSEHCVHKTLKSTISYTGPADDTLDFARRPGHEINPDGTVTISNLLKSTVAAATHELIADGIDWTLSVFVDNAGIIAFDDDTAVCVKVETHNHPSALEPYGGAATGIGGCIRDILGTGLAARPIASTDVFCVAHPDTEPPQGCLHPKRILRQITAGVRDYGNRIGIPTVSGAVWFDDRYIGNPLVYCGCVGVMPRDKTHGDAQPGDLIVAIGGRTGRDGIHGATFSSAELTDTHADEFSHAVQIGNPVEEKKITDVILRARDHESGTLYSAITDCGAGGFSSAVGEMGEQIGAEVQLERAPLKYEGLSTTEIWISEAQERMVLAVSQSNLEKLQAICDEEHVELAVLGTFGTPDRELVLRYDDAEMGRISMEFLHEGIPTPTRVARWTAPDTPEAPEPVTDDAGHLLALLADPNIASKHWIIRQYDHEVQGNTMTKPLIGPRGIGPSDASIVRPVPSSSRGLAISQGLATPLGDPELGGDPYHMAIAAIDECVRNLACVGADPSRVAILDNFCWPSCAKEENLASLVRAAEGCYDGAKAYRTPFVSGKDSLNNQFTTEDGTTIEIPPTLLITGIGIVENIAQTVTSDAKQAGNYIVLVGEPTATTPDLELGPHLARVIHGCIVNGLITSAHDVSEGGWLVAATEMCIGGSSPDAPIGLSLTGEAWHTRFIQPTSCYLVEVAPEHARMLDVALDAVPRTTLGQFTSTGTIACERHTLSVGVEQATSAWRGTLDW